MRATTSSPGCIAAFRARHPGIRARLTVGNREELLERLADARDRPRGDEPRARREPGFAAEPFAPHPHVIVAAPGHPLAGKRRVALEARRARAAAHARARLGHAPRHGPGVRRSRAWCRALEMEIASNETIKQAVAAGFGLGFLSAHAVQQELALGRLVVIAVKGFPVMRQWYVVQRRDRRLPPVAEAFQRFVVKEGARLIRERARPRCAAGSGRERARRRPTTRGCRSPPRSSRSRSSSRAYRAHRAPWACSRTRSRRS